MLLLQFIFVLVLRAVYCQGCQYLLPSDGSGVYNETEKGKAVVHDVLAMIKEANIFDSDHNFMRRLAYVETRDGEHLIASHGKYGIWGFDLLNFFNAIANATIYHPVAASVSQRVCEKFGINLSSLHSRDVIKPLVSGVLARFYLLALNVTRNKSIPLTIPEQAIFWKEEYSSRPWLNVSYFVDLVQELKEKGIIYIHTRHLVCNFASHFLYTMMQVAMIKNVIFTIPQSQQSP